MQQVQALTTSVKERLRRKPAASENNPTADELAKEYAIEKETKQKRDLAFSGFTEKDINDSFAGKNLPGFLEGVDERTARDILLASIAASQAYAYNGSPNQRLEVYKMPHAKLLKLIASTQLFSLMEAPGKLLFVAIPGTHDKRTTITDLKTTRTVVTQGKLPDGSACKYKVHTGFLAEARKLEAVMPTSMIKEYAALGYRIVVTGHSLGGALASLTTIRLLDEDSPTFARITSCITFGAPLIGNAALTDKITGNGWENMFHHMVYRSDIVPRVLTGRGLTRQMINSVKATVAAGLTRGLNSAKSLFGSSKEEHKARGLEDGDPAPEDELEGEEQLEAMDLDALAVEQSFAGEPELDEGEGSGDGSDAIRRAFFCYGRYHFLRRDVEYKSITDPAQVYACLRGGDGLKVVAADHSLLVYHAVMEDMLEKKSA